MTELEPLILDFLEWLNREQRTYPEVMDVWRTSCPRLTVWEDAVDRGYVTRVTRGGQTIIAMTPKGQDLLGTTIARRGSEGTRT